MLKLNIPDMSCGHCAKTITDTIMQLDATAQVEIDLAHKTVAFTSSAPTSSVVAALTEAGYPPAR